MQTPNIFMYISTIFKTFDSDLDKWTSKIGILGKTLDTIRNSISRKNSSDDGDLSKRLIVTSKDIEPQLYNIDAYDTFDSDEAAKLLSTLQNCQKQVDENKISWDDYYKSLKDTPHMQWQEEFIKTTNLQTASTQDVINAQKAARDAAVDHNSSLHQLTIGAKVSKAALNGLALAGNMLASFLVGLCLLYTSKNIVRNGFATAAHFPLPDEDGEIEYLGYRYSLKEIPLP